MPKDLGCGSCKLKSRVAMLVHQQPESEITQLTMLSLDGYNMWSSLPSSLSKMHVMLVGTGVCWLVYQTWVSGAFLKSALAASDDGTLFHCMTRHEGCMKIHSSLFCI